MKPSPATLNNNMNILYVTNARLPTEKAHGLAIVKTCEALAHAGHTVLLIAPERHNPLREDIFAYYGVAKNFALKKLSTLNLSGGRIGFLVQEISFAIHAALYLRGKEGIIYSRDDVVLWVLWLLGHRSFIWESHTGGWNFCARTIARKSRALVVISGGLKDFYVESGIPASKISVIPSAIDMEQFARPESKSDARKRLGLPLDAHVAMYIGRFDGWKGSNTLFEASKLLPADICIVAIGGEPHEVADLKARYPRVIFPGFRPYKELADNQSVADVLVVPNTGKDVISARFTSPLKLIAHMASGRPIVATDLPSIREITGSDAAVLVTPDDAEALAVGIQKVLADTPLGERLAKRALEKVERYTWKSRAVAITKLLANI